MKIYQRGQSDNDLMSMPGWGDIVYLKHIFGNKIRYIRNTLNSGTEIGKFYWVEITAQDNSGNNLALRKPVTSNQQSASYGGGLGAVTNGTFIKNDYFQSKVNTNNIYVQIDLQGYFDISKITLYYINNYDYKGVKTEVSVDGVHWIQLSYLDSFIYTKPIEIQVPQDIYI